MKRVELGGFTNARPGWENLDYTTGYDLAAKLLGGYADNSIDLIYSSHVVEHIAPTIMPRLCADIHRALKPGGLVRISGPDFNIFTDAFLRGTLLEFADTFWPVAGREGMSARDMYLNMSGNPDPLQYGVPGGSIGHAWPATANGLCLFLVLGGFEAAKIHKSGFRQSIAPELRHESFDNRESHSFFVEAHK